MYKFEISANTLEGLNEKMKIFAKSYIETNEERIETVEEKTNVDDAIVNNTASCETVERPTLSVAVEPVRNNNGSFDSRGIPWDERVHSAKKSLNTDGTWRVRRGVDPAALAKVEQELLSKIKAGEISEELPLPLPPVSPVTATETPAIPLVTEIKPVVDAPVYENIAIPSTSRPAHSYATFKTNLTTVLAGLINEGKIDQKYIGEVCSYFGIKNIWNVLGDEKQCIELFEMFCQLGFITKVD